MEMPLLRDLKLNANWKIVRGDTEVFTVTKTMHNTLLDSTRTLTDHEREIYLTHSPRNAHRLDEEYGLTVAHDPQPLAILHRPLAQAQRVRAEGAGGQPRESDCPVPASSPPARH